MKISRSIKLLFRINKLRFLIHCSNIGNKSYPLDKGHSHYFNNNDDCKSKGTSEPCPLHPNIDPRMYESQVKSIATSSSCCNCEGA